jgi:hypothetical protein
MVHTLLLQKQVEFNSKQLGMLSFFLTLSLAFFHLLFPSISTSTIPFLSPGSDIKELQEPKAKKQLLELTPKSCALIKQAP